VPGLRVIILLFDQVQRGNYHRAAELRLYMDTYGLTPKGAQDRRWQPPNEEESVHPSIAKPREYAHLRVVD